MLILNSVLMIVMMVTSCGGDASPQEWMTENLNVDKFRNGDPIPEARTAEEWEKAGDNKQPAWCYYDNDPANGEKYGKLYNWYAVNDSRGLAPSSWHIPSDEEWRILVDYLGGVEVAGTKMKSTSGWIENGNGTNESGFSGLPGGNRDMDCVFGFVRESANYWSSTQFNSDDVLARDLSWNIPHCDIITGFTKKSGLSVRCVKD